ncbi:MAG: hypothetical protein ACE5F5_09315 [Acidimicrobiia bacterium]
MSRLLWPALIVLVAILGLVVSAAGEERRLELEYLDEIRGQAAELSTASVALRDVASRLTEVDRIEFLAAIETLRTEIDRGLSLVADEPPVETLAPVRALYQQTLEAWQRGVIGFSSAVLTAADSPGSLTVVDQMAAALAEMRAGDRLYRNLVVALEDGELPDPVAPMPEVVVSPGQGVLVTLSVILIDAARSPDARLALRPGLAVSQIVSEPMWEIDPTDQAVVPATESIVFSVVVSNIGNVVSDPATLVLTLTGGPEQIRLEAPIVTLRPKQQMTVDFESLAVKPGEVYEVVANLVLTGDDFNVEDNQLRVQFTINNT